jgi:hypothetical protein
MEMKICDIRNIRNVLAGWDFDYGACLPLMSAKADCVPL